MLSLPVELLDLISSQLTDELPLSSLSSLSLVHSKLRHPAQSHIFTYIFVPTLARAVKFFLTILHVRPDLAKYVRSFTGPPVALYTTSSYLVLFLSALRAMSKTLRHIDIPSNWNLRHVLGEIPNEFPRLVSVRTSDNMTLLAIKFIRGLERLEQVEIERSDERSEHGYHLLLQYNAVVWPLTLRPTVKRVSASAVILRALFQNPEGAMVERLTLDLTHTGGAFLATARSALAICAPTLKALKIVVGPRVGSNEEAMMDEFIGTLADILQPAASEVETQERLLPHLIELRMHVLSDIYDPCFPRAMQRLLAGHPTLIRFEISYVAHVSPMDDMMIWRTAFAGDFRPFGIPPALPPPTTQPVFRAPLRFLALSFSEPEGDLRPPPIIVNRRTRSMLPGNSSTEGDSIPTERCEMVRVGQAWHRDLGEYQNGQRSAPDQDGREAVDIIMEVKKDLDAVNSVAEWVKY